MKKLFTLLMLFAFVCTANSAVFLRENFDASPNLPAGWTKYSKVDANSGWRVASAIRNGDKKAIEPYEWEEGTHYLAGIQVLSTGNYNEWLVSPEVTVPATQLKNLISFYTYYLDATASMTLRWFEGSDTSKAVVLWTATGKNEWDNIVEVDISKYAGKKGHFAWVLRRNVSSDLDGTAWGIDVIKAETVINGVDLEPTTILSPLEHEDINMYAVNTQIPVKVKVYNNGRTDAKGHKISYTVGGNTVTEDLPEIKAVTEITYTFKKGFTVAQASNANTITVSVQSEGDEVSDNNSAKINCFWVSDPSSLVFDFENNVPDEWDRDGFVVYKKDDATQYRNEPDNNFFFTYCWTVGQAGGTVASANWGRQLAFTSSDFSNTGLACDRWLVFPKVKIGNSATFLQWNAATANTTSNEGSEDYEVLVSTKTNAISDFKVAHEVLKEKKVNPNNKADLPSTRYIDLSSYKGKEIFIAFRDKTSGNARGMMLLDNVKFLGKDVINVTSVKEIEAINARIYPNPASDAVHVEAENIINGVEVFNALGQKVYSNNSVNEFSYTVPTQHFTNGLYIIRIQTEKGSALEKVTIAR